MSFVGPFREFRLRYQRRASRASWIFTWMRGLYSTRRMCGDGSTADGHFADRTCWREMAAVQLSAAHLVGLGRPGAQDIARRIRNKGCSFPGGSLEWQLFRDEVGNCMRWT